MSFCTVVIQEYPAGLARSYTLPDLVLCQRPFFIDLNMPLDPGKLEDVGSVAEALIRELSDIPGISGTVFVRRNGISLNRDPDIAWAAVEPKVLEALCHALSVVAFQVIRPDV